MSHTPEGTTVPKNTIALTPCESSQIHSHGYDAENKTLAVLFRGGKKVYHYPNVEPDLAQKFSAAESRGKFFGQHIKGREFTCCDLHDEAEAAKA